MHEYYKELARAQMVEEVREEMQQEMQRQQREVQKQQRKLLLMIVQAHFPTLVRLAKAQVRQINDVGVLTEIAGKVGTAQSVEEAQDALLNWQPLDDTTD